MAGGGRALLDPDWCKSNELSSSTSLNTSTLHVTLEKMSLRLRDNGTQHVRKVVEPKPGREICLTNLSEPISL